MVWHVIKKEIFSNLGSPKLMITYAVCMLLIFTALFIGASNYLNLKSEAVIKADTERDRLANIYNFQLDLLVGGMHIYRQPDLLSMLVAGIEGDAARRGTLTYYTPPNYDISKFNSSPILAIFGFLDLEFIVKIILSLFAILFTYDAISGEKEMGTLKLNFANELKRSSFILGKLIGNFLLLLFPFIIPLLLGLLLLQFIPEIQFGGEEWVRISLVILAFTLYLLVFFGMGMMVSALTKRPTVSFLLLLMLWVFFISVVPRVGVLAAQNLAPVPELATMKKKYFAEVGSAQQGFMDAIHKEVEEIFRAVREGRYRPDMQQQMQNRIIEEHDVFARAMQQKGVEIAHDQDLLQERQNLLAIALCRLTSPAASLTFAVHQLARTGVYSSDKHFRDSVQGYVNPFIDYNEKKMREVGALFGQGLSDRKVDVSDILPSWDHFKPESLEKSVAASLQDFAVLALLAIIFLAVAFVAFLRYDLR